MNLFEMMDIRTIGSNSELIKSKIKDVVKIARKLPQLSVNGNLK